MDTYVEIQKLAGWLSADPESPMLAIIGVQLLHADADQLEEDLALFETRCDIPVRKYLDGMRG